MLCPIGSKHGTRLWINCDSYDLRFDFPWFWDVQLLALAILAGAFSLSADAIRFFV